ncbi:MAG: DEAD/DEAH box helicase family protein [Victivallales bacterium]
MDIAMIQSLVKNDALEEIAGKYTQIIVDECHHIPAASFESVGENPPYRILAEYLTGSLERNEIIAKDIILELNSGHYPLVLTDRKMHIDQQNKIIITHCCATSCDWRRGRDSNFAACVTIMI